MKQFPVLLAALATAACNSPAPDPAICVWPSAISASSAATRRTDSLKRPSLDAASRVALEQRWADTCLQRWAYRLRRSDASHADLQEAVLGACEVERTALFAATADEGRDRMEAWAKRRASFFIVQAKVGACRAPEN